MSQTTIATTVTLIASLLPLMGVTGITSQDLTGFTNVIAGILTVAGIVWMHFAHKQALGRVLAGTR